MKFKILMLLSLALIAFFAVVAHSADWTNQQSLSADQLLSGGDQGTMQVAPGLAPTPQKSREDWSNKTGVNFTMPSNLAGFGASPQDSRNAAGMESNTQDQSANAQGSNTNPSPETTQVNQTTPPSSTSSGSVSGSWSFELTDNSLKNVVLTLFQSGDAVFGTGSMNDGNNTLIVAASGSTDGDKLNLDLTTLGSINLYRLALTPSGDSASGDYQAFSASGSSTTGSAKGTRSSQ